VQGTSVPKSVVDLAKKKTVTCFLDGDRGGDLILKELQQLINIDYIARAPEGYEVEDLTRKQMIKYLQKKKPISAVEEDAPPKIDDSKYSHQERVLIGFLEKLNVENKDVILEKIKTIETGHAVGYDETLNELFDIGVSELYDNLPQYKETKFLILDGILTERLLNRIESQNIKFIACKNKLEDLKVPNKITVFYF
jgi:DNA primase